jgi:hypothetical protein
MRACSISGESPGAGLVLPYAEPRLRGNSYFGTGRTPVGERDAQRIRRSGAALAVNLHGRLLSLQRNSGNTSRTPSSERVWWSPRPGASTTRASWSTSARTLVVRPKSDIPALGAILEGAFGVTFFTDNDNFFGGHTKQDPLYAAQTCHHLLLDRAVGRADLTYYAGVVPVDGALNNDCSKTLALGRDAGKIARFAQLAQGLSAPASSPTGTKFNTAGIAWQHLWGGGV